MRVNVWGPNTGTNMFEIHKTGCLDERRRPPSAEAPWPMDAEDQADVIWAVFSDIIDEEAEEWDMTGADVAEYYRSEVHFHGCCSSLPKGTF